MIDTATYRASNRIREAIAKVKDLLGDDCDRVFRYLGKQPGRLRALCVEPAYERNWYVRRARLQHDDEKDLAQLDRDLAGWVKAWEKVLSEVNNKKG